MVKHRNRLLREHVDSPPLETSKTQHSPEQLALAEPALSRGVGEVLGPEVPSILCDSVIISKKEKVVCVTFLHLSEETDFVRWAESIEV